MNQNSKKDERIFEAIKEWKDLGISFAEMTFDCGGDSMGDTNFKFYKKENGETIDVESSNLYSYFEDAVYNHVDFYEVSDGHYEGEFGTVDIYLEEDVEEGEESYFVYDKSSKTIFCESKQFAIPFQLSEQELEFYRDKIQSISGDQDSNPQVIYSKDILFTDEDESTENSILEKLEEELNNRSFDHLEDDNFVLSDECRYDYELLYSEEKEVVELSYTVSGTSYGEGD